MGTPTREPWDEDLSKILAEFPRGAPADAGELREMLVAAWEFGYTTGCADAGNIVEQAHTRRQAMRRCGRELLHEPHDNCDGRTRNEPMVGQLTVAELRAALDGEQDGALVAVDMDGPRSPLRLIPEREKGRPVFMLGLWGTDS